MNISGSLVALFLYDVCDEIRLEELRTIVKAPSPGREPPFRQPAPEYVQFARPPIIEAIGEVDLAGEQASGRVAYFDYGVMSLKLELPFSGSWDETVAWVSRWMSAPEIDRKAAEALKSCLERARPALVNEYAEKLSEDYYIILLPPLTDGEGPVTADTILQKCGTHIAQIVRGERAEFSQAELHEILESRMSYYTTDLFVVGWTAALVYDTPSGAAPTLQLLEYANSQLLEFRHYDGALTLYSPAFTGRSSAEPDFWRAGDWRGRPRS